jgi:CTP:molybdopterin cytidylyltransferase MocA
MQSFSAFAVVPAAGRSQRMGRPKLLLPWGESTLLEHVLSAWSASRVAAVVLVAHRDDDELIERARRTGAQVVVPEVPPPDMKQSVVAGLAWVEEYFQPQASDAWLVAPADFPSLSSEMIDRLLAHHDPSRPAILVAAHEARRGHPVLFPWPLAEAVSTLSPGEGLDALLARHEVRLVECGPQAVAGDIDTPDDYRRLAGRHDRHNP